MLDQATQQVVQQAQGVVYGGAGALGLLILSNVGQWIKEWRRSQKIDKINEKLDKLVEANSKQNERIVHLATKQDSFSESCSLEKTRNDVRIRSIEDRVLDLSKGKGG